MFVAKLASTIAVATFIIGYFIVNGWGEPHPRITNWADVTGGLFILISFLAAFVTVIAYIWRF